jgi:hypothetical protein
MAGSEEQLLHLTNGRHIPASIKLWDFCAVAEAAPLASKTGNNAKIPLWIAR